MPRDVGYGLSGVVFLSTDAFFQINFGGLCGTARHGTARHGTARYGMARHGPARQGTARHGTARHGTVPYGYVVPSTIGRHMCHPYMHISHSHMSGTWMLS
jgi:hypothetical protein